ncbi:MAG: hypothetical protein Q4C89_06755 [Deinococcus sp.]|uniref:hypothetical protein n=1 Tax=Deinococcus sp. TaxID=47478 RepID=UPI0026DCFA8E|nr:hypothetical protein [Deinococcus sp.]MDO4245704.1 hypothetical protein [Deinococcus sp.]
MLDALRLGAAELLTEHSNDEKFISTALSPYKYRKLPVLYLLNENQGNYTYGLLLDGSDDPPVLLLSRWLQQNGEVGPNRWRPFAESFAAFAFARLFDYQYRWRPDSRDDQEQEEAELSLILRPLTPRVEKRLRQHFKVGPTTPDVFDYPPGGARRRFYRPGQRVGFWRTPSMPGESPRWGWSWDAVSREKNAELMQLLGEVMK